jgi:hypothetical protein
VEIIVTLWKNILKNEVRKITQFAYLFKWLGIVFISFILCSVIFLLLKKESTHRSVKEPLVILLYVMGLFHLLHYVLSDKKNNFTFLVLPVSSFQIYLALLYKDLLSSKNIPAVLMYVSLAVYLSRNFWISMITISYGLVFFFCLVVWIQNLFTALDFLKFDLRQAIRYLAFLFLVGVGIVSNKWESKSEFLVNKIFSVVPLNFYENIWNYQKLETGIFLSGMGTMLTGLGTGLIVGYLQTKYFLRKI